MPTPDEEMCWEIVNTITAHLTQAIRKNGNCERLGETYTRFHIDQDGKARPHGAYPAVAYDTEVQPLVDLVDLEQIRCAVGLDLALCWGGPLTVFVSFEYDDRMWGNDWDAWEPEVSIHVNCNESQYMDWLRSQQVSNMAVPVAEEVEQQLETAMEGLTVGPV